MRTVISSSQRPAAIAPSCGLLYTVHLGADGHVFSPKKIVGDTVAGACDVRIASNGASYLIATSDGYLLDLDGNVVNTFPISFPNADVASDGHRFMITGGYSSISVLPVDERGEAGVASIIGSGSPAGIASDGRQYLVVGAGNAVTMQIVATDGTPLGPAKFVSSASSAVR